MLLPSYRETQDKWHASADDFEGHNNGSGFFVISRYGFDREMGENCWKFHISLNKDDLEKAWDALAVNEEFVKSIDILKIIWVEEIESSLTRLNEEFQLLLEPKKLLEEIKTNIESNHLIEGIKLIYLLYKQFQLHDPFAKEVPLSEQFASLKAETEFLPIVSDMVDWCILPRDFTAEKNDHYLMELEGQINIVYAQMIEKHGDILDKVSQACNATDKESLTEDNLPEFFSKMHEETINLMTLAEKLYAKIEEYFKYTIALEHRLYEDAQITIYVPHNSDYERYKNIIPLINQILSDAGVSPGISPTSDLKLNPFVSVRHESSDRLTKYDPNSDINRENPFKNCTSNIDSEKIVTLFFSQFSSSENEKKKEEKQADESKKNQLK